MRWYLSAFAVWRSGRVGPKRKYPTTYLQRITFETWNNIKNISSQVGVFNTICIFASFLVHLTSYICLAASPFLVKIVTSKILRHHCKSKRRHQLGYIKSYFEPLNLLYQSLFWNFDSALSNPILNLWFCYINSHSLSFIAHKSFCVGLCYQSFN